MNPPKQLKTLAFIGIAFLLLSCTCWGATIPSLNNWLAYLAYQHNEDAASEAQEIIGGMNCSSLHLTSPRDGLPNGLVTVYWDALSGAVNYRVNLYAGSLRIGTWEAAAPATNLQADVSQAAVGGQNPFELELLAFDANGNYCRDYVALNREAAPPQAPPVQAPSATPTCAEKPSATYC